MERSVPARTTARDVYTGTNQPSASCVTGPGSYPCGTITTCTWGRDMITFTNQLTNKSNQSKQEAMTQDETANRRERLRTELLTILSDGKSHKINLQKLARKHRVGSTYPYENLTVWNIKKDELTGRYFLDVSSISSISKNRPILDKISVEELALAIKRQCPEAKITITYTF